MPDSILKPFTYSLENMGCKANLSDSLILEEQLRDLGGTPSAEGQEADLFVLNTCTVTDQADRDALKIAKKTKSKRIIATGCMAEVNPEKFSALSKEDQSIYVVRNSAKSAFSETVVQALAAPNSGFTVLHGDRSGWHESAPTNKTFDSLQSKQVTLQRTRHFLKVQDGCDAFCSYCIIPTARGRSRSLTSGNIIETINQIVDMGGKEIVLTAIHAADYREGELDYLRLVKKVLKETNISRLRLTSLDPAEISDELLDLMSEQPRLCAHLHVSIQAAHDQTLADMKRNYNAAMVEDRLLKIAEKIPHAFVGMDLIAGYPTETREQFESGLALLSRLPFTQAHVFPYSKREKTAAARVIQSGIEVSAVEISRRAQLLRDLSREKFKTALARKVGTVQEMLTESKVVKVGSRDASFGHARNFHKILVPGKREANKLLKVRIVGIERDEYLKGELL